MKSVKSFLMFFLLSLASISIIFDWGEYTYDIVYKVTHKVAIDKYEEISNNTFLLYRKASFLSPYKKSKKTENTESIRNISKLDTAKSFKNTVINLRCAVKSYLHLLQLY